MTTETEQYFLERAKQSGIPTTESEIRADIQTEADANGIAFNNASNYSPWWNFLTAVAVKPVHQLVNWVITHVMPNLFIKTATGEYLDMLGEDRGVTRKGEATLAGTITMHRDSIGATLAVPANTWIKTAPINGRVYRVYTLADAEFSETQYTITVSVKAETAGAGYNLAGGYFSILEEPITGISYVENTDDWITSPGADKETDAAYRDRIRAKFTAVSSWHVNDTYKTIISEFTGIDYARIYIDPTQTPRGPASADALVLFDAGVPGESYLTDVNDHITNGGYHGHGDDILVKPFPETQHDLTATLYLAQGTSAETETAVANTAEQIIRCAFRENTEYSTIKTWPNARFSMARLATELTSRLPELTSVEFNLQDIVSDYDVPRLNNLTVTTTQDEF